MRRIVSRVLVGLGYEVVEAADGRQALDALAVGPLPDLCCVDWNLPEMDGLTFVTRVRENREWRDITLMMVTTESEHGQIVRALAGSLTVALSCSPRTAQHISRTMLDLAGDDPHPDAEDVEDALREVANCTSAGPGTSRASRSGR